MRDEDFHFFFFFIFFIFAKLHYSSPSDNRGRFRAFFALVIADFRAELNWLTMLQQKARGSSRAGAVSRPQKGADINIAFGVINVQYFGWPFRPK